MKRFFKNIIYAFTAQFVTMILSILLSLVVPKLIGVSEFNYWQLFIFYVTYVGLFHYGLNDGIYLKYGGDVPNAEEAHRIGNQFYVGLIVEMVTAIIIILVTVLTIDDDNRRFVWCVLSVYMIICNASGFLIYLFQAIDEIKWYSTSVLIDKIIFISFIILSFIIHIESFKPFILMFTLSKLIAFIYSINKAKQFLFLKPSINKQSIGETFINAKMGISLTFSNIASSLILGSGRMVIDSRWGISEFGKVSFSLTLVNFFLTFIMQMGLVLFPALRRENESKQREVYIYLDKLTKIALLLVYVFYYPISKMLSVWLPKYQDSLQYFGYMIPICVFDGVVQLLFNTYMKVKHKEKILLLANVSTLAFSLLGSFVAAYVFNSFNFVITVMVISVALRAIILGKSVSKILNVNVSFKDEFIMTFIYMSSMVWVKNYLAWIIMLICYFIYILINRKVILETITGDKGGKKI